MTGRFLRLLSAEIRTEWRYRIPPALGGLAAAWAALAAAVPAGTPYLLFIETATVGTFLVGALAVTERATGVLAALTVSPIRPAEYVGSRIGPLSAATVLIALPVLVAGGAHRYGSVLAAVGLTAVLLLSTGLAVAVRRRTLLAFLTWLPWPLIPLFAVPLAAAVGLLPHPAWYAVPTTGALAVIRAGFGPPAPHTPLLLGYLAVAAGLAAALAVRSAARPDGAPRVARTRDRRPELGWRGPRRAAFVHADARNLARDTVLLPIALSPLLLGLALRFGYPPAADWAGRVHGIQLDPYLPVIALLAVVLHVPVIAGMLGALAVLDDLDGGVLRVVRVSPLGLPRYLAYRLGAVTTFAALGLAVAAPLSGAVPRTAWPAVLLAVPVAPLFTLGVLAVARNRVQGLTLTKLIGLPAYVPIAAWWLAGPASWLLAPLPTYWVVTAWDGDPWSLAAGAVCAAAWLAALIRWVSRRL